MKEPRRTRVKVCCIASEAEARLAIAHGADAIGLVSAMPSGPGPIPEELIARIARTVPPGVSAFLLTCRQSAEAIVAQQRRCGVDTIQLCDRMTVGDYATLREQLPDVRVVQVIHVEDQSAIEEAVACAPHVSALLLDSGRPNATVKELGGTGRTHDWSISRRIRESVEVPIFLAGGLNPDNVAEAIKEVRPFGVDVCSGLRTNGKLDERKLAAFVRMVGDR